MNDEESKYEYIVGEMIKKPGITAGKMMSSPGIKYNNKVFAFYHKQSMGFRLGPDFSPDAHSLTDFRPLSPFKTKPPLKGWLIVGPIHVSKWGTLADEALQFTATLK